MAIAVASGFFLLGGLKSAISPLMGSMVALLPNCFFAYRLYISRSWTTKKMVRSLYASEANKIFLTAILFAIVLQIPEVNILMLLLGFSVVTSVFWFALILWRH